MGAPGATSGCRASHARARISPRTSPRGGGLTQRWPLPRGIPTYGYEYLSNPKDAAEPWRQLRAISHAEARRLAAAQGVVPARNNADELSFHYRQQGALRYVTWSDAGAVRAKVKLAKALKVCGVALFAIDSEMDPEIWQVLH